MTSTFGPRATEMRDEECRAILDGKKRLRNRDLLAKLNFRAI